MGINGLEARKMMNYYLGGGNAENSQLMDKTYYVNQYLTIVLEMISNRFKWDNLPDNMSSRFIERELCMRGIVVALKNKDGMFYNLRAMPYGGNDGLNWEGNPIRYQIQDFSGHTRVIPARKCVPIWNNVTRTSLYSIIYMYCSRLADFELTINQDAVLMRHPMMLLADENTRQSVTAAWNTLQAGDSSIGLVSPSMGGTDISSLIAPIKFDIPLGTLQEVQEAKAQTMDELVHLLGITGDSNSKRERLVVDESRANDSRTKVMRNTSLQARKEAAEEMNKRWGTDISVDWYQGEDDNLSQVEEV